MAAVVEVNDLPQLVRHMCREVQSYYPKDKLPTLENTKLEPYGFDDRIGWDSYLVLVNGAAWGYTNGPLLMTEDEALTDVRRTISGIVLTAPDALDPNKSVSFLVGDHNADIIIRALNSAGWSWVKR